MERPSEAWHYERCVKYRKQRDRVAMEELIAQYEPLLLRIAISIHQYEHSKNHDNPITEIEDLVQWGRIAMLKVAESFDPSKAKFLTLAYRIVWNKMRRHVNDRNVMHRCASESQPFVKLTFGVSDADAIIDHRTKLDLTYEIEDSLKKLDLDDQELVRSAYGLGCERVHPRELAKQRNITREYVYVRLRGIRAKLRKVLERLN